MGTAFLERIMKCVNVAHVRGERIYVNTASRPSAVGIIVMRDL